MDIQTLIMKLQSLKDEEVWTKMLSVEQLAKDAAWELQKVISNKNLVKENAEIRQKYKDLEHDIKEYQKISDDLEKENDDLRYQNEEIRTRYLREILGDFTFNELRGYIVDLIKEELQDAKKLQG